MDRAGVGERPGARERELVALALVEGLGLERAAVGDDVVRVTVAVGPRHLRPGGDAQVLGHVHVTVDVDAAGLGGRPRSRRGFAVRSRSVRILRPRVRTCCAWCRTPRLGLEAPEAW